MLTGFSHQRSERVAFRRALSFFGMSLVIGSSLSCSAPTQSAHKVEIHRRVHCDDELLLGTCANSDGTYSIWTYNLGGSPSGPLKPGPKPKADSMGRKGTEKNAPIP